MAGYAVCMKHVANIIQAGLLAGLLLQTPAHAAGAQQVTPAFEPASCAEMLKAKIANPLHNLIVMQLTNDRGIECGFVEAPEEHAKANGKKIKLAVVVLRANGEPDDRRDDPLFMMQGGPGGETISTFAILMALRSSPDKPFLRAQRDIVLIDQRGTGKSVPALTCIEVYDLAVRTAEQQIPYEEASQRSSAAIDACRERLVKAGVNLSAFDSIENAADIDFVRRALGYEQINLYGVSYGTLLALHAMRDHGQYVRSVILDAVVPTQTDFLVNVGQTQDRAYTELFKACAADARCNRDYPDLERVFYEVVAQLDAKPVRLRLVDSYSQRSFNAPLDGKGLQGLLFQMLYPREARSLLPRMIYDLRDGKTDIAAALASLTAFDQSIAHGMYYSVLCAEDSDVNPEDANTTGLRSETARYLAHDVRSFLETCKRFDVEQLPDSVDDPVRSDLPVLLMSGQFDPITPPSNASEAAKTLPNSYELIFPNAGHGALNSSDCGMQIAADFLNKPGVRPDTTCIKNLKAGAFTGPDDLITVSALGDLMRVMTGSALPSRTRLIQFGVLTLFLTLLATGLILLPLGWLARLLFNRNHPTLKPPVLANLMPLLTILFVLITAGFVAAIFSDAVLLLTRESLGAFAGVSGGMRPVFILPIVSLLLAVLITLGVIAGWRSGAWGLGRKLYRAVLAFAALGSVAVLAMWNLIIAPLVA